MEGKYIVIEGCDGSGKGMQQTLLMEGLNRLGIETVACREPGGSPIGESIRTILKDESLERDPSTDVDLLFVNRHENWRQLMRPALENGIWVVNDRSWLSTIAYQGYADGVNIDEITLKAYSLPDKMIRPDLTFIIDVPLEVAIERNSNYPSKRDFYEAKGPEFQGRVIEGYRQILDQEKHSATWVNGENTTQEVHNEIWRKVEELL